MNKTLSKASSGDSDSVTTYYHEKIHSSIQQIFIGCTFHGTHCVSLENIVANKVDKAQGLTEKVHSMKQVLKIKREVLSQWKCFDHSAKLGCGFPVVGGGWGSPSSSEFPQRFICTST